MTNNTILRQIRYTFNYTDSEMIHLFASGGFEVTRAQVSDWLKKEEEENFRELEDIQLAVFLNGLINEKRGKKEGEQQDPEKKLNNNIILRKLKIALNLRDTDILELFNLADMYISKPELSSFFRKPGHRQYRMCKDQFLRNFLFGMQKKYRKEV